MFSERFALSFKKFGMRVCACEGKGLCLLVCMACIDEQIPDFNFSVLYIFCWLVSYVLVVLPFKVMLTFKNSFFEECHYDSSLCN